MKVNKHQYVFDMFVDLFGDSIDLSGIEWNPAGKNTIRISTDALGDARVLFTYVTDDINALMTEGYYIAKIKGEI